MKTRADGARGEADGQGGKHHRQVLVTGANGFVGSAVVRALLRRGHRVRVLVRAKSDLRNLEGLALDRVVGDLCDRQARSAALDAVEGLFHVAADYRLWVRDAASMYAINVDATRALLEEAWRAGVSRIVHTSSVATIGHPRKGDIADESCEARVEEMVGHYKRSKFLGERAAHELARAGAPIVIVNPSTPVGPRDARPTPTGRVLIEAARGRMPAYVETGLNVAHVDDIAEGHVLAFERGEIGQRYILGGENLDLRELLEVVAQMMGRRAAPIRLPLGFVRPLADLSEALARMIPIFEPFITRDAVRMAERRMFFSSRRAEEALGYRHRPARDAIRHALAWFHTHGHIRARPHPIPSVERR